MDKPLTMVIKETRAKFADICNGSGLPVVVLDLIIQGLYSEIHSLAERQTMEEEKIYEKTIKEEVLKGLEGDANEAK